MSTFAQLCIRTVYTSGNKAAGESKMRSKLIAKRSLPLEFFTGRIIALFLVSATAFGAEVFPDPTYVTIKLGNAIEEFPLQKVWVGGPNMLYNSVTPDGRILLATSPSSKSVYAFDTDSGKQSAVIEVGTSPKGVKITPDGKEAYVSNEADATLSVVDMATFKVVTTIPTEKMPHNVRFTADGKTGYVTLQGGAGLGVIDTRTHKMTHIIPVPGLNGPHNLDLSTDEKTAFIRDVTNKVAALDLASGEVKKIIKVGNGHGGIDVMPDGRYVITGAIGDKVVTVIDPKTFSVVKQIDVGVGPHGVRASRDSRWIYVSVATANKVVVIDPESLEIAEEIPVGDFPFWIAVRGNP